MKQEEFDKISEILKEILSNHMHGGETDEVLAELDEQVQEAELIIYNHPKWFKPGEIVYSFEDDDNSACLFRIPEDYKGEDSFKAMVVVARNFGWNYCGVDWMYHEDGMTYRRATKEEIEIFNKKEE